MSKIVAKIHIFCLILFNIATGALFSVFVTGPGPAGALIAAVVAVAVSLAALAVAGALAAVATVFGVCGVAFVFLAVFSISLAFGDVGVLVFSFTLTGACCVVLAIWVANMTIDWHYSDLKK